MKQKTLRNLSIIASAIIIASIFVSAQLIFNSDFNLATKLYGFVVYTIFALGMLHIINCERYV